MGTQQTYDQSVLLGQHWTSTVSTRDNDFPRSQKTDGIRGIYPVKQNCIFQSSNGNGMEWSPNSLISLCFSLTLTLILIPVDCGKCSDFDSAQSRGKCRYQHSTCLLVIAAFFRFRNQLQWGHWAWLFLAIFILDNYSPLVRDRFRYTTHAQTLCKWTGACWNRPRTPESQHAWYDLMLGQRWLSL